MKRASPLRHQIEVGISGNSDRDDAQPNNRKKATAGNDHKNKDKISLNIKIMGDPRRISKIDSMNKPRNRMLRNKYTIFL